MTKRLYLLRHAKSNWKHAELADHDRPLAGRGRRAADAIARHMREQAIAPDLVLCSTARRARETTERIQCSLGTAPVIHEPGLYGASAASLLERLHRVPDEIASAPHRPQPGDWGPRTRPCPSFARAARSGGQVPDSGACRARRPDLHVG
jgi:phosphohistidine phosphatase SixA